LIYHHHHHHLPTERFKHKAEFLLQKGRCLNVAPDFSSVAEECLSRAVKLEPGLVEGWNTLGEQYWKKADLVTAKNCFTGALQQVCVCVCGVLYSINPKQVNMRQKYWISVMTIRNRLLF